MGKTKKTTETSKCIIEQCITHWYCNWSERGITSQLYINSHGIDNQALKAAPILSSGM